MDSSIARVSQQGTSAEKTEAPGANPSSAATERVFNPDRSVEKLDKATFDKLFEGDRPRQLAGDRTLEISFDDEAERVVVKVKSQDDEVVRQIPPDDYLKFVAKFKEMIGVLFDETA